MEDYIDYLHKKTMKTIENDMLSTHEGCVFWERYIRNRAAFSELEGKVLTAIKESGISVSEAIGFMQYMKYPIKNRSFLPQKKTDE